MVQILIANRRQLIVGSNSILLSVIDKGRTLANHRFVGSLANSRHNISAHYDLGNIMFESFRRRLHSHDVPQVPGLLKRRYELFLSNIQRFYGRPAFPERNHGVLGRRTDAQNPVRPWDIAVHWYIDYVVGSSSIKPISMLVIVSSRLVRESDFLGLLVYFRTQRNGLGFFGYGCSHHIRLYRGHNYAVIKSM
jgi:hypothetical protein